MNTISDGLSDNALTQEQESADCIEAAAVSFFDQDPINILIVDDEPKNLTVLETILDNPRYRLIRAESADQALLALVAEEFSLLILDIRMPGMTGFELAQVIKQRKKTASVPIIFLTAYYGDEQHVLEGYDTGAVDYLHKPVNPAILRSKVAVFAELHGTSRECGMVNRALLVQVSERRRAQEQLRELNETLEYRVAERTQALRASEERFKVLAENIPQLAWIAEADGSMNWFNQRWLDFTGTTFEENLGTGWKAVYHPDYVDPVMEKFERHISTGKDWEDTFPLRGRDGRFRWFLSRMSAIRDESGKVVQYFGTNTDVTDQREHENALRESEERYRTLFAAAPMAVFACDRDAAIQHYNRHAAVLLGREPASGVGQDCESIRLWLPDGTLLPHTQSPILAVLGTGVPVQNMEVLIERSDGSRLPVLVNVAALNNAQGEIIGAITSFMDITERKQIELNLIYAIAVAEKANRAKSDFLSSMSHELRTPLNAILGFAQLLESSAPALAPVQMRNLDQILKGGWYLLELINEILDLPLIESGKLSLTLEPVSLAEVMRECQAMFEPQARRRGITMTFPSFDVDGYVRADRTRVKQVLINLLSNAIKYNKDQGAVTVEWTLRPPDSIRLSVRDTGEGLAPQHFAQLFMPFNRLGKEAGAEEGTGIGLVLAKRLVEMMGGAMGAESDVGVGSVFWFEVKRESAPQAALEQAAPVRAQAPPGVSPPGTPQRTVLCVEDNLANLELIEQLMGRRPDLRLLSAGDGNRGIELTRAHQPQVILLDVNLPGISGIEVMKILRADPSTAHIPIVALSANALPGDIKDGIKAGFFNYLTKPIKVTQLMDVLDMALDYSQSATLGRAAEKEQA